MSILNFFAVTLLFSLQAQAYSTDDYCGGDIQGSYQKINPDGASIMVGTNSQIPGRFYTQALVNKFGYDNHFQGAARLKDSNYAVISGADYNRRNSNLLVVSLGTEPAVGPWHQNFSGLFPKPPASDQIIANYAIGDSNHWHAGGISRLGDVIVVPVEEYIGARRSRVLFFDFSNPLSPVPISVVIDRPTAGAGNAGMIQLDDGTFMVALYTAGTHDFYFSNTNRLEDGFKTNYFHLDDSQYAYAPGVVHNDGGSSLSIVKQCKSQDGTPSQYFMFEPDNDGDQPPIINGKDRAYLYQLQIANAAVSVTQIGDKAFNCSGFCNFAGSVGVSMNGMGGLDIFGPNFFRDWIGTTLRMKEFFGE